MARFYRQRKRIKSEPIGSRLQKIRNHFGYTQGQMAAQLELSRTSYSKNEKGVHLIDITTAVYLHNKMDISLEWLLFNKGPMFKAGKGQEQAAAKGPGTDPETGGMLKMMERIPFIRHAVIGFFQKFTLENDDLIRKFEETEKKETAS